MRHSEIGDDHVEAFAALVRGGEGVDARLAAVGAVMTWPSSSRVSRSDLMSSGSSSTKQNAQPPAADGAR